MGPLTPYDVKRWDLSAIQMVFETANGRANTLQHLGDNLQQVQNTLSDWRGEAGEAFRADVGKTRRDIEADGQESRQVAAAVSRAEADVSACKRELADIERAADAKGWTITPDWRIDVGDTWIGRDPIEFAAQQQLLQDRLIMLKVRAEAADHELAAAIRGAVGEGPLAATGPPAGGAPPPQGVRNPAGGGKPRTWQDMLLPEGPADPGPGRVPAGAPPVPTQTAGKPLSLQDLLTDGDPLPGQVPVARPGAPPYRPTPADIDSAKALLRPIMRSDGVPPDQIEGRINDLLSQIQPWLDHGMPHYIPPEPQEGPPPPGFGDGFRDRWFATEEGIHNLFGVGGPKAPGVFKSWQQMLKGTVETAINPVGGAISEVKNLLESPSPAYYFGGKAADGAFALPGLLFGGEGAAVEAGLGDIGPGVLETGPVVSSHLPIGFDHPPAYHSWAEGAATDLNYSFLHGGPTVSLSQQLADMSTHYVGESPDRVVLGRFDGQDGGYIGEARSHGGIYYDTGPEPWGSLTRGVNEAQTQALGWAPNEAYLRTQMENHVPRIEYLLPDGFDSVDEVARVRRESFSAFEINFLDQNGAKFGYRRIGNAWVYEGQ